MINKRIRVSPPNSLVFLSDTGGGEPPIPVRGAKILSTPSCISIACYPEQDGPTEIVLGELGAVDPGRAPDFDENLETPNRRVEISTADYKVLLATSVTDLATRVRIWRNHPEWPTQVIVGLS